MAVWMWREGIMEAGYRVKVYMAPEVSFGVTGVGVWREGILEAVWEWREGADKFPILSYVITPPLSTNL